MKSRTFFIFWPLLVWLALLLGPKALCAEVDQNGLWSLQFKDVSISEALRQITQTTGIKIISPSQLGSQVITKSYKNQTIEHILKDIFRDMNYALVWSYGEKGIDSVRILALDKVGGAGAGYSPDAERPDIRDHPAARYPAQRQSRPKGRIPPSRRSIRESEPEDTDSEASAEPEEKTDDQAEDESKEEDKESMSSSEKSDEETPVPQKEMTERSDEDVEKDTEEPPSEVGQSGEGESGSSSPGEAESTNQQ